MENASKALIIVGAILLSILIIGMGMGIFTGVGSQTADAEASMDSTAIQSYNANFEKYKGTRVKGSEVEAFISYLHSNAITNVESDSRRPQIHFKQGSTVIGAANATDAAAAAGTTTHTPTPAADIVTMKQTVVSTDYYKIDIQYHSTNGLVTFVNIERN